LNESKYQLKSGLFHRLVNSYWMKRLFQTERGQVAVIVGSLIVVALIPVLFSESLSRIEGVRYLVLHAFEPDRISDLGSVLFGITGGILSLVGLIAIFVSINSQHKIEKCRELIWEVCETYLSAGTPIRDHVKTTEELYNKLTLYGRVYSQEKFVEQVIGIARKSIITVLLLWDIYVASTDHQFNNLLMWASLITGIIILMYFYFILGRLIHIEKISALPLLNNMFLKAKEMTDAPDHDLMQVLLLIAKMKIMWEKRKDYIHFVLPSMCQDFKLNVFSITCYEIDLSENKLKQTLFFNYSSYDLLTTSLTKHTPRLNRGAVCSYDFSDGDLFNMEYGELNSNFLASRIPKLTLPPNAVLLTFKCVFERADSSDRWVPEWMDNGVEWVEYPVFLVDPGYEPVAGPLKIYWSGWNADHDEKLERDEFISDNVLHKQLQELLKGERNNKLYDHLLRNLKARLQANEALSDRR
jgi:hypothetical protein